MRILITGITGFIGGHLAEAMLQEQGHTIVGISRQAVWPAALAHLQGRCTLVSADLLDQKTCLPVIADLKPDWVFHLAGFASPNKSFEKPDQCWQDNVQATRLLYDAIAQSGVRPRILFTSTSQVYGEPAVSNQPVDEYAVLKPTSPYAASKAAADLMSFQYSVRPKLDVMRVRLFTQIGPRQSTDYFSARFAQQIAAIEQGKQKPVIETGDLSGYRDLTDIRDVVRAFRLLMNYGQSGEVYNAGHGETWQVRDVLNQLRQLASVHFDVVSKNDNRPVETMITRANPAKLQHATGWKPNISLAQTLKDVLDYWRLEVQKS